MSIAEQAIVGVALEKAWQVVLSLHQLGLDDMTFALGHFGKLVLGNGQRAYHPEDFRAPAPPPAPADVDHEAIAVFRDAAERGLHVLVRWRLGVAVSETRGLATRPLAKSLWVQIDDNGHVFGIGPERVISVTVEPKGGR